MLEKADIKTSYSRSEMLDELQKIDQKIDREIYTKDFERLSDIRIHSLRKEFGSWTEAKKEAGLIKEVNRDEMISDLKEFSRNA